MVKKHLISCSLLFLGTVAGTVYFGKDAPTAHDQNAVKEDASSAELQEGDSPQPAVLTFANEPLPNGDKKVDFRMKRMLRLHDFHTIGTNELHTKAALWFPVIEPILASYGIPDDFKYVTLVESGLNGGTSVKGASGFWQFMPGTARSYGLRVNREVDERQNMRKSTVAACKYLKSMYAELKSWTLVAAAYNLGDTKLKAQMFRQKEYNYFKMKLNRETAGYVYRLISMKEIIEKPVRYGYKKRSVLLADRNDRVSPVYPGIFNRNAAGLLNLQN